MPKRTILAAVAVAVVVLMALVSTNSVPNPFKPTSTGVALTACDYDSSGNVVGSCSNAFAVPVGQSVANIAGNPVAKIGIAKSFVLLNYTGSPSSGTFTATERIDYAKGMSDSYPISLSIASPVPKNISLQLPVSSLTASLLQSKWGTSYGPQVVNVTIANSVLKLNFAGVPVSKPSAYNFVAQFKLTYGPTITTTATSSTTTTSVTSTTSTSTTTFASSTTSTTTAIRGGTISTGTVNIWTPAVTQITGGMTGNAATNGVAVAVQPGSQSQVTVFLPAAPIAQQCAVSCAISISLLTQGTSTSESLPPNVSNVGGPQDSSIGKFISWSFLASTSQGDTVVVTIVLGNAQIFNQAVIVDGATTSVSYTALSGNVGQLTIPTAVAPQYQAFLSAYNAYQITATAAANAASTDPCNHLGLVYNAVNCRASLMSIVSVSF